MTITIEYINQINGNSLGIETYSGLDEAFIPDYKAHKHDVYIRRIFSCSLSTELWKVEHMHIAEPNASIFLTEQKASKSLGQLALNINKKPATLLPSQKYQLVEVEFGFQQNLMAKVGDRGKNTTYPAALMPGELHKKRPCIAISCSGDRVQVIPISTKGARHNLRYLQINRGSFSKLARRYTTDSQGQPLDCYAIIGLFQTVSVFRVYPMRSKDGSFSNDYNNHTLVPSDLTELKDKLASFYANDVKIENIRLEQRVESLSKEKNKLIQKRSELNKELKGSQSLHQEKTNYINLLEGNLVKLAQCVGTEGSISEVIDYIESL